MPVSSFRLCCIVCALSVCAHVRSSSAQQPAHWRLVEEWRKGGAADGPYAFEGVLDLKTAPGGRLVTLDRTSLRVQVFDSGGVAVRSAGGRGGGPGEFRAPMGFAVAPNGSIVVNDPGSARFSLFTPDAEFLRGVTAIRQPRIAFNILWDASFDRAGRLMASVGIPSRATQTGGAPRTLGPFNDSTLFTERWSVDFARSDSAELCGAPPPVSRNPANYTLPPDKRGGVGWLELPFTKQRPYYARDLDGLEWAPRELGSGELVRRESGHCGVIVARAVLRGRRVPIPPNVRNEEITKKNVPSEFRDRVPREYPWYRALRVDDQNRLWVQRDAEGTTMRFEVFSMTGVPLADMDAPRTLSGDLPMSLGNGRLYGFAKDDDGILYLVAWRIVVGGP